MKNIVLYRLAIVIGCSMMFQESKAQKPSVVLLPSLNQHVHSEGITDTNNVERSLVINDTIMDTASSSPETTIHPEISRKEKRERWFDLDSLFRKKRSTNGNSHKSSRTYPLLFKYISPVRLFIHISALK